MRHESIFQASLEAQTGSGASLAKRSSNIRPPALSASAIWLGPDRRVDGSPIRLRNNGRRHKAVGLYFSVKSGRHLPYESRLELHDLWRAEVAPEVVESRSQPFTLRFMLDGELRCYTPDRQDVLEDGQLRVVEVKDSLALLDEWEARRLQVVRHLFAERGPHLELHERADIERKPAFAAVQAIQRHRRTRVTAVEIATAERLLAEGPVQLGEVIAALGGGALGFARASALMVGRPVSVLLWPMSVQMLPQFPTAYPAGRFSGAASFGDDAELNIQRAAEELRSLLGPAPIVTQYNTRRCEWRAGAAAVRLTCWAPELQTGRLHNPAHKREPRLVTACHVEVTTGFRLAASPQEDTWLRSVRPIGPIRGDRRLRREDVVSLAPYEAEVAFVREPEPYLATTYGRVGASADRRALIFCHTQLYAVPLEAITAFRVERLSPAKSGGGSWLDVLCETGEPAWPTATLKITSADEPDALNGFGTRLAAHFGKPFELGEPTPDV